jgi:hypothetical protein
VLVLLLLYQYVSALHVPVSVVLRLFCAARELQLTTDILCAGTCLL